MYLNRRLNLAMCFWTVRLSILLTLTSAKQQNPNQIWCSLAEIRGLPKQFTCMFLLKKKHPTPKTTRRHFTIVWEPFRVLVVSLAIKQFPFKSVNIIEDPTCWRLLTSSHLDLKQEPSEVFIPWCHQHLNLFSVHSNWNQLLVTLDLQEMQQTPKYFSLASLSFFHLPSANFGLPQREITLTEAFNFRLP